METTTTNQIILNKTDEYAFAHLLLKLGEMLIDAGGEIYRVEHTLKQVAKAYGALSVNVFMITAFMVITLKFPDDRKITESRQVKHGVNTNFTKLEKVSKLCDDCCKNPVSINVLASRIEECDLKPNNKAFYIGSVIAAFFFCILFSGTLIDAVFAGALGLLAAFLIKKIGPLCKNNIVLNMIAAFVFGALAYFLTKAIPALTMDTIVIADIMILLPGLTLTNGIRDVLVGDTISGVNQFIESVLWTGGLAIGIVIAFWAMGGVM